MAQKVNKPKGKCNSAKGRTLARPGRKGKGARTKS